VIFHVKSLSASSLLRTRTSAYPALTLSVSISDEKDRTENRYRRHQQNQNCQVKISSTAPKRRPAHHTLSHRAIRDSEATKRHDGDGENNTEYVRLHAFTRLLPLHWLSPAKAGSEILLTSIPGWRVLRTLTLTPHAGCPRGDPFLGLVTERFQRSKERPLFCTLPHGRVSATRSLPRHVGVLYQ
jgi:hypothetical protein